MCGIAGFQGTHDEALLGAMSHAVAHRGPDGQGEAVFVDPGGLTRTGFAHRRLAIIAPTAEGNQPMSVDCDQCGAHGLSDLALTYNGEIYNYRELRDELRGRGHRFRTETDSEVLLHLFADEGLGMLARLNGIFAFAIRKGRGIHGGVGLEEGEVLLARDALGVKPLYLTQTSAGTAFASELKALLRDPMVSRALDHEAIHYMLAYLWTPSPRTALREVRRLEPGCAVVLRGGRPIRQWRYYDLPVGGEPLTGSVVEVAAKVREAVDRAVARQMVSDVPVGAFLSGGLDSSAVVASMRATHPESDPLCYCIGFSNDASIEGAPADMPFARRVAAHLGVRLREIVVDASIVDHLERTLWALDEPQGDPAPINSMLIAEQARRDGVPVLLSGTGGDDIFSGYRRHFALRTERAWSWLPQAARVGIARVARAARGAGPAWARRASKAFAHADLPTDERLVSYFWWSDETLRRTLYASGMADELRHINTASPLLETLRGIDRVADPLERMLYLEARHFLGDHNLNYTDKSCMAAAVEVRVPLLDLDLVALAARIPPRMKQSGSTGKAIFKRAMESRLPREVIYRPKTGFGVPLRRWVRRDLQDRIDEALSAESIEARGLFDAGAVRRLIELDRAGVVDGSYTVFALLSLELWCRMFVDPPVPALSACE